MTDTIKMDIHTTQDDTSAYFATLLPWQQPAWEQVTQQFYQDCLPHGLLAGGMSGIGKRAFVWRLAAWLLCTQKTPERACGECASCTWLQAGTHPDLLVLPASSRLGEGHEIERIKIDDIRHLQEYSYTKGQGVRLIVLDDADTLTLGAANALLKTLEEPRSGVHLLLISDNPARLLPTIKSRVQALPLMHIDDKQALNFVASYLTDEQKHLAPMLLQLADYAPLNAVHMPKTAWFTQRMLWLKTLVALRLGKRSVVVASDYWQGVLNFADFMYLTRLMLVDVLRVILGLPSLHTDIAVLDVIDGMPPLTLASVQGLMESLDDMMLATHQNVQDKMAYDQLLTQLADL